MKTITRIAAALLAASISTSLLNADTMSLAKPKDGINNFTVSAGFTMLRASTGGGLLGTTPDVDGSANFYGGTIAFGWRFHRHHGLQIEEGFLIHSESSDSYKERDIALPLLFSYNFYIPWAEANDGIELRISPAAGFIYLNTCSNIGGYGWVNDNAIACAYGLGIGVTVHLDSKYYVDVAYRYLRTGKIKIFDTNIGDADTHALTFSAGVKF